MKLLELFNQKYLWDGFKSNHDVVTTEFKTEDGSEVSVLFSKFREGNIWEVEFMRDGDYSLNAGGDATKIFATVLDIIQEFYDSHEVDYLTFSARLIETSRVKFYDRIGKKIVAMGFTDLTGTKAEGEPKKVEQLLNMKARKQYMFKAK